MLTHTQVESSHFSYYNKIIIIVPFQVFVQRKILLSHVISYLEIESMKTVTCMQISYFDTQKNMHANVASSQRIGVPWVEATQTNYIVNWPKYFF